MPGRDAARSARCKLSNVKILVWPRMVLYASYIFLPISRRSSNERPLGSGEVECKVAATIGYGLGALAKSLPQWKASLAILCIFPTATARHSTMCKTVGMHLAGDLITCIPS